MGVGGGGGGGGGGDWARAAKGSVARVQVSVQVSARRNWVRRARRDGGVVSPAGLVHNEGECGKGGDMDGEWEISERGNLRAKKGRTEVRPVFYFLAFAAASTLARNLAGLALKSSRQPSQQMKMTRSGWPVARWM
jgi:hypothetical protein